MKGAAVDSQPHESEKGNSDTYLAKLARFWMTLAMSVRVREVRSSGYSCMRLKRLGDMMAGHRKRRKSEALMSRSLRSCLPRARHCCFQEANTSFSSRGKTLGQRQGQDFRTGGTLHPGPMHHCSQKGHGCLFSVIKQRQGEKCQTQQFQCPSCHTNTALGSVRQLEGLVVGSAYPRLGSIPALCATLSITRVTLA